MAKSWRILSLALLVWLLVWIALSWPAMQDDALIHLRYADHLLHLHRVSYNGTVPDFGSSSLLYIALLAALRAVFTSPLLPRVVSTQCHLLLFAGLYLIFNRELRRTRWPASVLALLLLAILAAPSAVRWLDDGMETSLGLCMVALFAVWISRLGQCDVIPSIAVAILALLGFFAVLLRVEFLLLLGIGTLLLMVRHHGSLTNRFRGLAPLAGGLLAAAFIVLTMHHLLPDTALAKSVGLGFWHSTLTMTAETFLSSLSFGLLLLALWLLSAVPLLLLRRSILPVLLANSLFPALLAVSTLRGQAIQGVRYFAWALLFSIVWNLLELARLPVSVAPPVRWMAVALCVLYLLAMPFESHLFLRVFRQRAAAIEAMRAQHLERLHNLPLTAYDVGFIGYFTGSPVCDLGGLVNGRAVAAMDFAGRIRHCAALLPTFAFGSIYQLDGLNTRVDLSRWSVCATYDLANLHASDLHYLVAAPATVAKVCGVTGNTPQPLAAILTQP
jgi:hypothetical protein